MRSFGFRSLQSAVAVVAAALLLAACSDGGGDDDDICERCSINEVDSQDCFDECALDCLSEACLDECEDLCDGCGRDLSCVPCQEDCESLSTRRCAPFIEVVECSDGFY
ncbi:MAG TPA: hypothetical protein VEB21_10265 [Terriglobales bacterium]|nr:hypothetical protein [Terriglobales bacterium]